MELLERSDQLSALADSLDAVHRRGGRDARPRRRRGGRRQDRRSLQAFCDGSASPARVLWGACDALLTPGPLGPLFDIAEATGGELEELVAAAAPGRTRSRPRCVRELAGGARRCSCSRTSTGPTRRRSTCCACWRARSQAVPALVARQLPRRRARPRASAHARARRAGQRRAAVTRLAVPTALAGRRRRARRAARDRRAGALPPDERQPVLRHRGARRGDRGDPADRARRGARARGPPLAAGARGCSRRSRSRPRGPRSGCCEALAPGRARRLEECLASGMVARRAATACRSGTSSRGWPSRTRWRPTAGSRCTAARSRRSARLRPARADPARLAHHAEAAGDAAAVLRFAPAAAARAASLGAHREAAAQYARALRFADGLPPRGAGRAARAPRVRVLPHRRARRGDRGAGARPGASPSARRPLAEGDCLRSLSRLYSVPGPHRGGRRGRAAQAVALLEGLPPGRELALAYAQPRRSSTRIAEDAERGHAPGARRRSSSASSWATPRSSSTRSPTSAPSRSSPTRRRRRRQLERSLELALRAGLEEQAGRAYVNLVVVAAARRRYDARRSLPRRRASSTARERGLDLWRLYLVACRARAGARPRAAGPRRADSAALVLRDRRTWPVPRILALTVLGLVRARRGDPTSGRRSTRRSRWPSRPASCSASGRSAAARAEAAWLAGATARAVGRRPRPRSSSRCAAGAVGGRRAGRAGAAAPGSSRRRRRTRRRAVRGRAGRRLRGARPSCWTALGCPYEAALALAGADDDGAAARALDELQRARRPPAAAIVARRLRERGVRGLPRGPRADDAARTRRAHRARARGARARRPRACATRDDRRAAVPLREDRRPPRLGDPAQARRAHPRRGQRRGRAARRRPPRSVARPAQSRDVVRCGGARPLVRSSSFVFDPRGPR